MMYIIWLNIKNMLKYDYIVWIFQNGNILYKSEMHKNIWKTGISTKILYIIYLNKNIC